MQVNNALFAENIMTTTKTKTHLKGLLNICSNWANKWKLNVSHNASKTFTNQNRKTGPLKLQGHNILETTNRTCKQS